MSEPLDPPQPPSGGPPPDQPPSDTPPPPPGGSGPGGGSGFSPPPAGGGGEGGAGGAQPPGNPWEQRESLGFVNAFIETVKLFALNPTEAFAQTRRTGDYVGPLIFAVLVGWIGALFQTIWGMIFQASLVSMLPADLRQQMGGAMVMGGSSIIGFILYPIFAVIGLFIASGILHLCAMLVGALAESTAGFEGTLRVVAFSWIATLGYIVPVIGGLVVAVWFIFLAVIGLSTLHKTTQGKALITVLIPVALCCVCVLLSIFGLAGMIMGMANR
jgi:hypothetical protein